MVGESKVSAFYNSSEYTDIEMGFHLSYVNNFDSTSVENKFIHIYPQGEDKIFVLNP